MQVETFSHPDIDRQTLEAIRRLCNAAFDNEFTDQHWSNAQGGWHVVAKVDGQIVSHAAVVPRKITVGTPSFRAGYVEAVATMPLHQGAGLGRRVMGEVADHMQSEYELGALSTGLHRFYEMLGWERWNGQTFEIEGSRLARTPDRDTALMVMRFGASERLALGSDIVLGPRPTEI